MPESHLSAPGGRTSYVVSRIASVDTLSRHVTPSLPPRGGVCRPSGSQLADALVAFAKRFVVIDDEQAIAVALWILHTHTFAAAEATPYLLITSAEKRSGKSRLLDVLEVLVARPWRVISPTEAVLFRKIESDQPTLLLDEYDTIFTSKREMEGLRAILNAGHRARTSVPRIVGEGRMLETRDFAVFSPKALAGIGEPPETVADRCIRIRLKRRSPEEAIDPWRYRDVAPEAQSLHDQVAAWAGDKVPVLAEARAACPEALDDRAADGWEPLLAIADHIGNGWQDRARDAAVLLASGSQREDQSLGVRLLADIRSVFDSCGTDRISSTELVERLADIDEAPWGDVHGRRLDVRGLARRLKRFEIRSKAIRFGTVVHNGYTRGIFADVWLRYLGQDDDSNSARSVDADALPPLEEMSF